MEQGGPAMRLFLTATVLGTLMACTSPAYAQTVTIFSSPPTPHYVGGRGDSYFGPHGHWRTWDQSWGDPGRYARQWGFDEYHPRRGWRRDQNWYAHPSDWRGWGGWNWSFELRGGRDRWDGPDRRHYRRDRDGPRYIACYRQFGRDWVRGRMAQVSFKVCTDPHGRSYEEPGSRRFEGWLW